MVGYWVQLTEVLEEEIAVGEELERNLAAQKKALIDWDVTALLEQIAAREPWLRSLGALERKRANLLSEIPSSNDYVTLRQLISAFPQDAAESSRLRRIRERAQKIFTRLHHDERALHRLMEHMVSHIEEALRPLLHSPAPLYGEKGAAELPSRSRSALIRNKA